MSYRTRDDLTNENIECVWITCQPKKLPRSISRLVIACIYLPPNLLHDNIEKAYDYLSESYDKLITESPDSAFIITGDFNPRGNGFDPKMLSTHCNLKQIVHSPTRKEVTLDLIFTNIKDYYSKPEISAPLGTSDHSCVKLKFSAGNHVNSITKRKVKVRPVKESNLTLFRSHLSNYDWNNVLSIQSLDEKVDQFTYILTNAIDSFFPLKTVKFCNDKPFITGQIKYLISKHDRAYKNNNKDCYKYYRNKVTYEIRKEKEKFYDERVKSSNSKQWWKNVKQICNLKRPTGFTLLNKETNAPLSKGKMAETINCFFSSLTSEYPPVSQSWFSSGIDTPLPNVSEESIVHRLKNINQNKAPGPFDPPLKIIKSAADLLGPVMCNIINN